MRGLEIIAKNILKISNRQKGKNTPAFIIYKHDTQRLLDFLQQCQCIHIMQKREVADYQCYRFLKPGSESQSTGNDAINTAGAAIAADFSTRTVNICKHIHIANRHA